MTWAQLVTEQLMPALPKRGPFEEVTSADLFLVIAKLVDIFNTKVPAPDGQEPLELKGAAPARSTGAGFITGVPVD